jgi:hypothetical protein
VRCREFAAGGWQRPGAALEFRIPGAFHLCGRPNPISGFVALPEYETIQPCNWQGQSLSLCVVAITRVNERAKTQYIPAVIGDLEGSESIARIGQGLTHGDRFAHELCVK